MSDQQPTTAYRRIASNKFYARLLTILFFVWITPIIIYISAVLGLAVNNYFWYHSYVFLYLKYPWLMNWVWEHAGEYVVVDHLRVPSHPETTLALSIAIVGVVAIVLITITFTRVMYVSRFLPAQFGAIPLTSEQGGVLRRRLENLCLAAGLPMPKLFVLPSQELNAFSTGPDPERASVVLTEGLLNSLSKRELDAVLAHELAHIRNYDIRVNSRVAAIARTMRLPLLLYVLLLLTAFPLRRLDRFFDLVTWVAGFPGTSSWVVSLSESYPTSAVSF